MEVIFFVKKTLMLNESTCTRLVSLDVLFTSVGGSLKWGQIIINKFILEAWKMLIRSSMLSHRSIALR